MCSDLCRWDATQSTIGAAPSGGRSLAGRWQTAYGKPIRKAGVAKRVATAFFKRQDEKPGTIYADIATATELYEHYYGALDGALDGRTKQCLRCPFDAWMRDHLDSATYDTWCRENDEMVEHASLLIDPAAIGAMPPREFARGLRTYPTGPGEERTLLALSVGISALVANTIKEGCGSRFNPISCDTEAASTTTEDVFTDRDVYDPEYTALRLMLTGPLRSGRYRCFPPSFLCCV